MSNPTLTIAKREWSARFNSPVAYVFLFIFLGCIGFFTFNISSFYESGQAELSRSFFVWHPWLFLILIPAVSMGIWSEERRANTIELLFTTAITPMQAIVGKYLSAWLFVTLAILLTFPVIWTTYSLGNPDGGVIFSGYLGSILLAGAYLAIGMFTSALSKNQVISFIIAVVIGLFLILAGFPPVTDALEDISWIPQWLVNGVASFSFISHYETLQRGIIDFRDLFYFGSVIVFMLFATQLVLNDKASS